MGTLSPRAGPSGAETAAEPTFAERARTLLHVSRVGVLATRSRRHPGYPFASVMPYALDGAGSPLFLVSTLALHTQNLLADPRASLLVAQTGTGDPLALARATVIGDAHRVSDADEEVREAYLARHPHATSWVGFGDFGFWRLDVVAVYVVGGFAAMDWVEAAAYRAARPDPLVDVAEGIVEDVNRNEREALRALARARGFDEADDVELLTLDRLGMKLRVRIGPRQQSFRVAFPSAVADGTEAFGAVAEALKRARRAPRS